MISMLICSSNVVLQRHSSSLFSFFSATHAREIEWFGFLLFRLFHPWLVFILDNNGSCNKLLNVRKFCKIADTEKEGWGKQFLFSFYARWLSYDFNHHVVKCKQPLHRVFQIVVLLKSWKSKRNEDFT